MNAATPAAYDDALNTYLRLASFPVAVTYLKGWDEAPPKARRPARDLGNTFTTCQAISCSRRHGWVSRSAGRILVRTRRMALGLEKRLPHRTMAISASTSRPRAGGRTTERGECAEAARRGLRRHRHRPLAKATVTPDVVIIYGTRRSCAARPGSVVEAGGATTWCSAAGSLCRSGYHTEDHRLVADGGALHR